jgi:hypothetical protein
MNDLCFVRVSYLPFKNIWNYDLLPKLWKVLYVFDGLFWVLPFFLKLILLPFKNQHVKILDISFTKKSDKRNTELKPRPKNNKKNGSGVSEKESIILKKRFSSLSLWLIEACLFKTYWGKITGS